MEEMYVELVEHTTYDALATIKYKGMSYLIRGASVEECAGYIVGLLQDNKDIPIYVDYMGYGKILFTMLSQYFSNVKLMQYSIVR